MQFFCNVTDETTGEVSVEEFMGLDGDCVNLNDAENAKTVKLKKGGPSLAIGRGEKLPAAQGAGLTAKGRAKYNRETGSNLKAPQPSGGARRDSFCARMGPVAEKSEKGSRARASMQRWACPGW
jgi:hypothetical protein